MFGKLKQLIIVCVSILILAGCSFTEDILSDPDTNTVDISTFATSIEDLEQTDIFRAHALEHILEGELNGRGEAVGFHYDGLPTKKGEIIPGTESMPNDLGVFEAEVSVSGVSKTSNGGKSTFFPNEWSAQEVVDGINEAYAVRKYISGNTYEGLTIDGQVIRMYLDDKELIISAFPVY